MILYIISLFVIIPNIKEKKRSGTKKFHSGKSPSFFSLVNWTIPNKHLSRASKNLIARLLNCGGGGRKATNFLKKSCNPVSNYCIVRNARDKNAESNNMSMNFMYPFETQQQFNNLSLNSQQPSQQHQVHGSDPMRLEFQIKETQIETLEQEVKTLKNLLEAQQNKTNLNNVTTATTATTIPTSIEEVFTTLSESLEKKDQELKESKNITESLITAITLNPTNNITKDGRYDPETIAHKLMNRLEILTEENKEMGKMLSYGRSQEMSIQMNLLTSENTDLKNKIIQLEKELKLKN